MGENLSGSRKEDDIEGRELPTVEDIAQHDFVYVEPQDGSDPIFAHVDYADISSPDPEEHVVDLMPIGEIDPEEDDPDPDDGIYLDNSQIGHGPGKYKVSSADNEGAKQAAQHNRVFPDKEIERPDDQEDPSY